VERAAGCHQPRQNSYQGPTGADDPRSCSHKAVVFLNGGEVRINPITGNRVLWMPAKNRPEIPARFPVEGLKVFRAGVSTAFEWITPSCIDESDCIDAQCRAGWDDRGYGFGGLEIETLADGQHRAKWSCGVSLD